MNTRYLAACLLLFVKLANAQTIDLVKYIGIEHGLSNNAVTSIYQDHNGFMWFGTYDGLNRYDGYTFKIFRNIIGDTTSIGDNHIGRIEADVNHNLWIGCEKGVYVYNPANSKFSRLQFKPWNENLLRPIYDNATRMCSNFGESLVLVGVNNKGLLVFEKNSRTGIQIPLPGLKKDRGNYTITAIAFDSLRKLTWVFIQDFGLYQYIASTRKLIPVNHTIRTADCLKVDSEGNLWIGTENGLFQFDSKRNFFSTNKMPSKLRVVHLSEDRQHVLWIASDGGGVWSMPFSAAEATPYLSANGTPMVNSNAVYSIYEDNEGRKWIGTLRGGINLIQPYISSFKTVVYNSPSQDNPINNFILSFCEDEKNNVWIGTDGAGLHYWDRKSNHFISYLNNASDPTSISSNFITGIFRDSQNDLWVSTWFGGVNRLKRNSKVFEHFTCYNPKTTTEEHNAWLVYEDAQKRLWASTTNSGTLYFFNRSTNRFELFDENITNLQCIAEDSEGSFWGGNYTSLIRIDRVGKKHINYTIGHTIRCIREDKNKNLWIGTDGGGLLLFNRNNGRFQRFTTAEGLPSNTILRLLEDGKNNLWLSTYNGLCKFNTVTKTCRNFSQSDGLQSNQFSFNAALSLKSGEFLFGGIKGFNVFYPDSVYDKKETPKVFLTGLKINNTSIEENDSYVAKRNLEKINQVNLPFNQAILSLDFVALDYTGTDKIKYAYLLEGWDKNWIYVNNIRTANYSRLQEGTYIFKIKVTNSDGVWSPERQLLKIVVLPPWYRAWWAYLLYASILFSVFYLYIVYSKRQERLNYEVKLAHLENEKEKELTEKKISFFTHISHEFRTPLTLIISPLKDLLSSKKDEKGKNEIFSIYRNARRLLSLVDQLLLFRKVESIDQQLRIEKFDIVEACKEVYLSFSHHAISKNIDFGFEKASSELYVYGDKEKIEIILFNLVSNAFKYTCSGGNIILLVSEDVSNITIVVKDTGTGIPAEIGNKLFDSFYQVNNSEKSSQPGFGIGLYVSQKLAEAHLGVLSYTSEHGVGTEFSLSLLKGKKHFSAQSVSEEYTENNSTILHELVEEPSQQISLIHEHSLVKNKSEVLDQLTSDLPRMLVVDDNVEIRSYISSIFKDSFVIYEADDGIDAYELAVKETPDIIISDVMMKQMGGLDLCRKLKDNPAIAHTPVILLTASFSDEARLKGIEGGAEDYITKPFDKEIIIARVQNILKARNRLQQYFFNSVTLKPVSKIQGEHKEFIDRCISIVENHLDDPDFSIPTFCKAIGMSHPSLYKKVKAVSGLTVNVFIRYIRLRKAAELIINTDKTITEITYSTGFNDIRYFREQFYELFQMNPSDYLKKYRKVLASKQTGTENDKIFLN
jgi:signal transduction histidine kinase/ligand-binding sensor domain-containing protein/CheY-like chemotaxis protein/AraC-like DNA-binding protein